MNQPAQSYEILIVDDSAVCRKLVERALASEPYSLIFAKNGAEALELYHKHSPSMVITDWMMPDLSGLELCKRIRGDRTKPYTYLILMTSNREKGNVVEGLQSGADDFLTKPFDPEELLARIGVGRRIIELNREIAGKNQQLEEAARTDPLTGLPNRRAIEDWALRQMYGAARHGYWLWVVVGDIDCFKTINDTYGHEAGDTVLKAFAGFLKRSIRTSDLCGRLGGDEFLLLITHVEPEDIGNTVNRFREEFASLSFPFRGESINVKVSFGVAGFRSPSVMEFSAMVRRADEMLYAAKRDGRNLVRVAMP